MAGQIGLQEAVQQLRRELSATMAAGAGEDLKFEVASLDVELQVAVARTDEMKGDVKFWVLSAGAGGKEEVRHTHTFKLRLLPRHGATGEDALLIADEYDEADSASRTGG